MGAGRGLAGPEARRPPPNERARRPRSGIAARVPAESTEGLAIDRQTAAAAEQHDVAERRGAGRTDALIDLSRGRQALLAVAPPGLGAVLALGGLPSLRVALIGVVAAAAGCLAVLSLEHVLERRFDAAVARVGAGADGAPRRRTAATHAPARDDLESALLAFSGSLSLGAALRRARLHSGSRSAWCVAGGRSPSTSSTAGCAR